jgi:deoxyadenosine/deoxycytidine kinase
MDPSYSAPTQSAVAPPTDPIGATTDTIHICVDGLIGVGKTVVLDAIERRFPDVYVFHEPLKEWATLLELFYKAPKQHAFQLQLTILRTYRDARALLIHKPIIVWERSPVSGHHMFTEMLYRADLLTTLEYTQLQVAFKEIGWTPAHCVYLRCNPTTAYDRLCRRDPPNPGDCGITPKYIEQLYEQYEIGIVNYPTVYVIDGEQSKECMATSVTNWLQHQLLIWSGAPATCAK